MYKLSVPISIERFNENKSAYFRELKKANVDRVFLAALSHELYIKDDFLYDNIDLLCKNVQELREKGYEVGFWFNSFGHGTPLLGVDETETGYIRITGSDGEKTNAICPLDKNFRRDYAEGLLQLAKANPDYIMLDDDFRLNTRKYNLGCCCDQHMQEYQKRLGEKVEREDVYSKVMQGGKNRYRDVWLSLMHDTIIDFAEYIRARLDEVAPEIPIIACSCFDTWGSDGYDSIELTEILAGKGNRKILRTIGAPYHYDSRNFIHGVEITRMQANWCAGKGIETMCEGDVYPRPRYAAPSQALELYDIALRCVRATDGILKYMFDYVNDAEYETGYVDRHVKNGNIREQLEQIFEGKSPVGIRIVSHKGLIESWDLPYNKADEIKNLVYNFGPGAVAGEILSHDAIPTVYGHSGDYPIALFGENAKYISDEDLKNGAFLDAKAAKILHDRGIDTGIISYEEAVCASEELNDDHTSVVDYGSMTINKMRVSEKAHVLSILKPLNSPGAYLYENEDGLRFYCIAIGEFTQPSNLYIAHYLLQEQRVKALEWTGRKHLPAVCKRNPHLYQIASEDAETGSLAVLLANNFMDNIPTPRVTLGRNFSRIRFVNCTGELNGNKVTLSEISPYGFAAFEVSP